jgi:hypothetical protein
MRIVAMKRMFDGYIYYKLTHGTILNTNAVRTRWLSETYVEHPEISPYLTHTAQLSDVLHCVTYRIQYIKVRSVNRAVVK